jgi:hypothetical protein
MNLRRVLRRSKPVSNPPLGSQGTTHTIAAADGSEVDDWRDLVPIGLQRARTCSRNPLAPPSYMRCTSPTRWERTRP